MTTLDPEGLEKAKSESKMHTVAWSAMASGDRLSIADADRFTSEIATAAIHAYEDHVRPGVTTLEELDALPDQSVVLDDLGDAWQKRSGHWESVGDDVLSADDFFRFLNLKVRPAAVIHRGGGDRG